MRPRARTQEGSASWLESWGYARRNEPPASRSKSPIYSRPNGTGRGILSSQSAKPIEVRAAPKRRTFWLSLLGLLMLQQALFRPVSLDTSPPTIKANEHCNGNDASRAVFLISMGTQAQHSKIVERFVWSIRNRGNWDGWMVLLTDAPQSRYANLTQNWIVMNPQPHHFNSSFAQDMPYKRFKTYLLDYLDLDDRLKSVSLLYYLDVDIVAVQDLAPMMCQLETHYRIPNHHTALSARKDTESSSQRKSASLPHSGPPRIWFFEGNYKKTPVQGGQMIMDRFTSKPCLERWRYLIDQHPEQPKDQPYLLKMLKEPTRECEIKIMRQDNFLRFPSNKSMTQWVQAKEGPPKPWLHKLWYGPPDLTVPTMIHIKNSGKVGNVSEDLEGSYLHSLLQLPEGQDQALEIGKKIHFKPDAQKADNL